jgi:hypothetical protein
MYEPTPMTWERLKDKLRAHGVPGWCDESPRASQEENAALLANWESEGGRTAAPSARGSRGARIDAIGPQAAYKRE